MYLITPPEIADGDIFLQELEAALSAAPVACLQIRFKTMDHSSLVQIGKDIVTLAQRYDTAVVINDSPDIALKIKADGAHIGQDDMDYFSSRELLGKDAILGVTCHNSRDLALRAAESGADYVAFGAFFETPTKTPKTRADMEILTWWQDMIETPCVAIGGITVDNAADVIKAGADFIAVSSGVWAHPDGPAAAISQFSQLCAQLAYARP